MSRVWDVDLELGQFKDKNGSMSSMIAFWLCGLHITLEFFDSQKTHVSYTFFLFRIQVYWHNFQWSGMNLLWKTLTFYLQDVMSCLWCITILESIIFANLYKIKRICILDKNDFRFHFTKLISTWIKPIW